MKFPSWVWLPALLVGVVLVSFSAPASAEIPEAPPVSKFAPAEDLAAQADEYIEDLEEAVASESEFEDSKSKVEKSANTLVVIALALGLHDTDNAYKAGASAMIKAAQELAMAENYAAAKKAVAALKAAKTASGSSGDLKWAKVANLKALMEQVPLVNIKLKRYTSARRFERKAKDTAGYAAVLAAIAQGSMANAGDTEKPNELEKWYKYCAQMRDAAAEVNKNIRAGDIEATEKAMEALAQSCDDCHAVFHEEAL